MSFDDEVFQVILQINPLRLAGADESEQLSSLSSIYSVATCTGRGLYYQVIDFLKLHHFENALVVGGTHFFHMINPIDEIIVGSEYELKRAARACQPVLVMTFSREMLNISWPLSVAAVQTRALTETSSSIIGTNSSSVSLGVKLTWSFSSLVSSYLPESDVNNTSSLELPQPELDQVTESTSALSVPDHATTLISTSLVISEDTLDCSHRSATLSTTSDPNDASYLDHTESAITP